MTLFGSILLLAGLHSLTQSAFADTVVLTDVNVTDQMVYFNTTVVLNGKVSVLGNGILVLDTCTVIVNNSGSGSNSAIELKDNASFEFRRSTLTTNSSLSSFCLSGSTTGSCHIEDVEFKGSGEAVSRALVSVDLSYVAFLARNFTLNRCDGGISLSNCLGISIEDLAVIGGSGVGLSLTCCTNASVTSSCFRGLETSTGLALNYCKNVTIRRCRFEGMRAGDGVTLLPGLISMQTNQGIRIEDSVFMDNDQGIDALGGQDSAVRRCQFVRNNESITVLHSGKLVEPLVEDCEFIEGGWDVSVDGHSVSGGPIVVHGCQFRFSRIAMLVWGRDWVLKECTFDYCWVCVEAPTETQIQITGCQFNSSILMSILWDMAPEEGLDDLLEIRDNLFQNGSGIACRIFYYGHLIIVNNTFCDLSGGGVQLIPNPNGCVVAGNRFANCSTGLSLWGSRMAVDDNMFTDCTVAVQSFSALLDLQGGRFVRCPTIIHADGSDLIIGPCTVEGHCSMIFNSSAVSISPLMDLRVISINLDNMTRCILEGSPFAAGASWELDVGSVLELRNCALPPAFLFQDDLSEVRVYWPLVIRASWRSTGLPVQGVVAKVLDRELGIEVTSSTSASGSTPPLEAISFVIHRAETEDWADHRIVAAYLRWNLSRDIRIEAPTDCLFELDDESPQLGIVSPPAGGLVGTDMVVVEGWYNDSSAVTFLALSVDGGLPIILVPTTPWRAVLMVTEGDHTITADVRDEFGNSATLSTAIEVDLSPPAVLILEPREGEYTNMTKVTVSGRTDPLILVSSGDVTGQSDSVGAFALIVPLEREGRFDLVVRATDRAGHSMAVKVSIVVDWMPPGLNFIDLHTLTNTTEILIRGNASEALRTLRIGNTVSNVSQDLSFEMILELKDGYNGIEWACTDLAGNSGSGHLSIFVDTAINLTITNPSDGASVRKGWLKVEGMTDPEAVVTCAGSGVQATADASGHFEMSVWADGEGTGSLTITATDAAGNLASRTVDYEVLGDAPTGYGLTGWAGPLMGIVVVATVGVAAAMLLVKARKGR